MKKKIGILHPYIPEKATIDEQDVLEQAEGISAALKTLGFDPVMVKFDLNMEAVGITMKMLNPAFVFNLVESVNGRGSLIHLAPSFLDYLGLPYTGSKTEAMFLTSNKVVSKCFLSAGGINTPTAYTLSSLKHDTPVRGRFIIKSAWEHASIGLSQDSVVCVEGALELIAELKKAQKRMKGECYCEQYIDGREFNVGLLAGENGVEVLPPAEIVFVDYPPGKLKIVDYKAKWKVRSFEYLHTDRIYKFGKEDEPMIESMKKTAKECWDLFGLKGYARLDFRVDGSGKPWVLEVNANPCLSLEGGFAVASALVGLDFPMIVKRIIEDI
ncbi:MAG: D-alanine--D-alanine ligase [Desulfobacteraceae bacterium]|nr:MAG: D-alanine--D-alanine ligase [Desulfobacteraceae bacterium]